MEHAVILLGHVEFACKTYDGNILVLALFRNWRYQIKLVRNVYFK